MKVLVITGSPHKKGTTATLASEFIRGAEEMDHEVVRFDAGFKKISPCIACERCHTTDFGCVFKDDMEELNEFLIKADCIAFITPIYYYDMNAQIKTVIDRFYANDQALHGNKKMVIITAMADDKPDSADGANVSFQKIANFMDWEIAGKLNAVSCWTVDNLKDFDYEKQAYELGKNL